MSNLINRRTAVTQLMAATALVALPSASMALTTAEARSLIDKAVAEITSIINSGKPEAAMLRDFEGIFARYGDVSAIGQLVLGPDGRSATATQRKDFSRAFQGYVSRKYGRRFRDFIGGKVTVQTARQVKSFYEVTTTSELRGQAPFEVVFFVSDKSGRNLFFDLRVEGVSLIKSERAEIGAMLDKRKGNLDQLISDLKSLG